MNIIFSEPMYLFLLFIIPIFIFLHFVSIHKRNKRALKFANFKAISRVKGIDIFSKSLFVLIFNSIVIFLLVFSLAGSKVYVEREISEFSFVFAFDVSQSMSAKDMVPNRLEFSKSLANEFLDVLPSNTQVGIVSFGAYSFIENQLTSERTNLKSKINSLHISSVGGTGFYEVFVTSSNLLLNENSKVLVLFSDGQSNIDDLELSIRHAVNNGIIVYSVPIGTEEGGEIFYGQSVLDKNSLRAISYQTNGKLIEGNTKEEIINNFKEAVNLNKGLVELNLTNYLMIIAIFVFFMGSILINLRYGSFP